jgi:ribonuclease P protein component
MVTKYLTIKKPQEFKLSLNNCQKIHTKSFVILAGKTPSRYLYNREHELNLQDFCRVGITVSKQVSKKSTSRNLIKRRIKNSLNSIIVKYAKNHYDYIIIAKKNIIEENFQNIYNEIKFAFKKINNQSNKL